MPRGWALGVTWQLPEQDQTSHYKDKMLNELSILFGGRIAEEVFINQMSTGASNDFERATKMARAMVTKYGMSDASWCHGYEDENQNGFFGNVGSRTISEATQQKLMKKFVVSSMSNIKLHVISWKITKISCMQW